MWEAAAGRRKKCTGAQLTCGSCCQKQLPFLVTPTHLFHCARSKGDYEPSESECWACFLGPHPCPEACDEYVPDWLHGDDSP